MQLLGEKETVPVPGGTADHVTEPAGVRPPSATVAEQVAAEPTVTLSGLQLTAVVVAAAVVVVLLEDEVLVLVVVEEEAEVAVDVVDVVVELVEVVDAAVELVDVVVELVAELDTVELGGVVVVEVEEDVAVDVTVVVLGGAEMRDETPTPTVTNTTVITAMTGTVVMAADLRLFLTFLKSLGYS